jgi:hypothetical protein
MKSVKRSQDKTFIFGSSSFGLLMRSHFFRMCLAQPQETGARALQSRAYRRMLPFNYFGFVETCNSMLYLIWIFLFNLNCLIVINFKGVYFLKF